MWDAAYPPRRSVIARSRTGCVHMVSPLSQMTTMHWICCGTMALNRFRSSFAADQIPPLSVEQSISGCPASSSTPPSRWPGWPNATPCTKYIYLDGDAPLVLGDRRLRVIGLHGNVDDGGAVEWATVAERLLCRSALLRTCGSPIRRITLSGGSIQIWEPGQAVVLTSITSAVDEALREGCLRWHLSRPAVSLSPSRANVTAAASHPNRRRASNIAPTLML